MIVEKRLKTVAQQQTTNIMKTLAESTLDQVETLEVKNSVDRSIQFAHDLASLKKFFRGWDADDQSAKIDALARSARRLDCKSRELRRGGLHRAADYVAGEVVEHVQAIRQLTGKPYAL